MHSLTTICSPHLIECNDAICLVWRLPLNIDLLFKRSSLDGFQGNWSRNYRNEKQEETVLEAPTSSSYRHIRRHQEAKQKVLNT